MKSAYFSYTFETPKIGSKLDYEVSGGVALKKYLDVVVGAVERDSGVIYHGLTILTQKSQPTIKNEKLNVLLSDWSVEVRIKESVDLNEELLIKDIFKLSDIYMCFSKTKDVARKELKKILQEEYDDIFQIRLINKWDTWKYVTPLLGAKLSFDVNLGKVKEGVIVKTESNVSFDTNFANLHIWNFRYKLILDIVDKFSIAPMVKYRLSEDVDYVQGQIELNILF
jgi:hypothetical protein